jgi:hypothetical protein
VSKCFVNVTYSDIVGRESGADIVFGVTDDGVDGDSRARAAVGAAHLDAVLIRRVHRRSDRP